MGYGSNDKRPSDGGGGRPKLDRRIGCGNDSVSMKNYGKTNKNRCNGKASTGTKKYAGDAYAATVNQKSKSSQTPTSTSG